MCAEDAEQHPRKDGDGKLKGFGGHGLQCFLVFRLFQKLNYFLMHCLFCDL